MGIFMEMEDYLSHVADLSDLSLTNQMIRRFSIFYEMLIETNKSMNLTAITDMEAVVLKHFIDSVMLSKYFDLSECSVIDVGTGAGFPGIPLAIFYSNAEFVLLDSLKKRLRFIDQVLEKCELNHVTLIHGRAEDFGRDEMYREQFDFCVSRAVASLPVLLELCTPFVRVGGKFISYKSEQLAEELEQSKNALSILKCKLNQEIPYHIPDTDYSRILAVFNKKNKIGKQYPRQAGKPKRSPLL